MEDTLRVIESLIKAGAKSVLILVLMEDTLRVKDGLAQGISPEGLNPCFNGRYSQRVRLKKKVYSYES